MERLRISPIPRGNPVPLTAVAVQLDAPLLWTKEIKAMEETPAELNVEVRKAYATSGDPQPWD